MILHDAKFSTKIEYFTDFFRKVADIVPINHICRPFYADITYLCTLVSNGIND